MFKFQSEQLDEETKKQINLSKYTLITLNMYNDKDSEDEEEVYQKKILRKSRSSSRRSKRSTKVGRQKALVIRESRDN